MRGMCGYYTKNGFYGILPNGTWHLFCDEQEYVEIFEEICQEILFEEEQENYRVW